MCPSTVCVCGSTGPNHHCDDMADSSGQEAVPTTLDLSTSLSSRRGPSYLPVVFSSVPPPNPFTTIGLTIPPPVHRYHPPPPSCRITVITFLMPVSVFLNTIFYWRAQYSFWYSRKFAGAGIEAHQERVQVVIDAIMAWKNSGMTTKLTTSRSVGGGVELGPERVGPVC